MKTLEQIIEELGLEIDNEEPGEDILEEEYIDVSEFDATSPKDC